MFQGFWVLGWSVGVLLLGAMTILIAFYSESARIELEGSCTSRSWVR